MRIFFAFEIPEITIKEIESRLHDGRFAPFDEHAKKLKVANWHCTVLFFRDFPESKFKLIEELLQKYREDLPSPKDLIDWNQFQVWESVFCLVGKVINSESIDWFTENITEEIKQYSQFSKLEKWKPHISLYRIRNKSLNGFQQSVSKDFPLTSNFSQRPLIQLSVFKSPPIQETGVYERLLTFDLT